jgi:hypothetical protein
MARVTEEIKAFREDSAEHDRFVRETLKPATKRGLG